MKKPIKIEGTLGLFNRNALLLGLKAINYNADILTEALNKINELEDRVRTLEGSKNEEL